MLMNGTQAKNVFWMVNGSVSIGDSSSFNGNIVVNNGAIDLLKGSSLSGRALTTNGSISTTGMTAEATEVGIDPINSNRLFTIYPNPFSTLINVRISSEVKMKSYEMRIYNILGVMVLNTTISNDVTSISASNLSSGVYFYYLIGNEKTIQSGKLISKQ
jgi:hypothetical protein